MRRTLASPRAPGSAGDAGSRPKVFVVGGGPFQVDIVRTARALGATVVVADRDAAAPALALADHPLVIDVVDLEAMVEAARVQAVDGVVTAASDAALPAVAAIGAALGLRALAPDVASRCRDKLATFEAGRAAGVRVPETALVEDEAGARAAAAAVGGFPVIFKPRSAAGGRGVSVVRSDDAIAPALAKARRYDAARGRECLVQAFVGGHALGVEAFFWGGALVGGFVMDDQFTEGFVSPVGHSLPSELDEAARGAVLDDVRRFAAALGLGDGPANFDLRRDERGCTLLEVNARLGGNSITELVRAAHDVDLSAAAVLACLGEDPSDELVPRRSAPTAARLLLVRGEGVAVVEAPFAAVDREGLLSIELAVGDGDAFTLRVDERAIVGRCLVQADTASRAAERAARVASQVRVGARA